MNKNFETITINWESLGARLATLTTDEQVPFFRGFTNEMNKYPSTFDRDMQLVYIVDTYGKFTDKQKEVLLRMGEKNEV